MNNRKRKRKETKRKKISPPLRFPLFFIVLLHTTADDWSGGGKMVYKEKESFLS
jgi:hypothetical protein